MTNQRTELELSLEVAPPTLAHHLGLVKAHLGGSLIWLGGLQCTHSPRGDTHTHTHTHTLPPMALHGH